MAEWVEYNCPECGHGHLLKVIPASRHAPAELDGDPPDECAECGAPMEGTESEPANPDDYRDWDREAELRYGL